MYYFSQHFYSVIVATQHVANYTTSNRTHLNEHYNNVVGGLNIHKRVCKCNLPLSTSAFLIEEPNRFNNALTYSVAGNSPHALLLKTQCWVLVKFAGWTWFSFKFKISLTLQGHIVFSSISSDCSCFTRLLTKSLNCDKDKWMSPGLILLLHSHLVCCCFFFNIKDSWEILRQTPVTLSAADSGYRTWMDGWKLGMTNECFEIFYFLSQIVTVKTWQQWLPYGQTRHVTSIKR